MKTILYFSNRNWLLNENFSCKILKENFPDKDSETIEKTNWNTKHKSSGKGRHRIATPISDSTFDWQPSWNGSLRQPVEFATCGLPQVVNNSQWRLIIPPIACLMRKGERSIKYYTTIKYYYRALKIINDISLNFLTFIGTTVLS